MKTNYLKEALKNPKFAIFYKGKEVRRYAFYRQAKAFCLKHNGPLFSEDKCELVNLETGEECNYHF